MKTVSFAQLRKMVPACVNPDGPCLIGRSHGEEYCDGTTIGLVRCSYWDLIYPPTPLDPNPNPWCDRCDSDGEAGCRGCKL